MSNLSVRGLEPEVLALLKARASQEGASVNALVLRMIRQGLGQGEARPARRRFDDLDALAGTWSQDEATGFEAATAPFGEVEASLWK